MSTRLADLARVVRSKNAGPFELTVDVIFGDRETFDRVRRSGVLGAEAIARLYRVPPDRVLVATWHEPALAFKATLVRPVAAGAPGDGDVFGCQQHVPLLDLELPDPPA